MKKSLNKSLFVAVVVAILSFVCAVASFNFSANVANAEEALAVPTTYTTAGETEFYLQDGASVRLESSGIKFQSVVTKDFHNQISANGTKSVVYYATANAVGKKAMALKFPIQPDFTSSDSVELRTYINFLSLEDDSAAAIAAYAVDFATSSYAQVDNGDGTYTYYRAFSEAKTGDNDIIRSMRAVANVADLKGEEGVGKYFTLGKRDKYNNAEASSAYLFSDGTAYVDLPEVSAETVVLYNGAKALGEYEYNAEKGVYGGVLSGVVAGDYISAFVDGKVYSTKAVNATKIVDVEGFKALEDQDTSTQTFVLDADLDLSSITTWSSTSINVATAFKGVLDGLQHKIYNYTVRGGIFGYVHNAVIKNLQVEVAGYANQRYVGAVVGRSYNSTFENVYVDILSQSMTGTSSGSAIAGVVGSMGTTSLLDSMVVLRSKTSAPFSSTGDCDAHLFTRIEGVTQIKNTYVVNASAYNLPALGQRTGSTIRVVLDGVDVDNVAANKVISNLFDFDSTKLANAFLKDCFANTLSSFQVIELTQANFRATLEGATSGYYVLTEDIDMASMTSWSPTGASFTGTLDGKGFAIKNFTPPSSHAGLLPHVNGATIKNLNLHALTNNNRGVLTGQVKGPVFVENCVFDIDKIASNNGGLFNVVQGAITLNNVVVNVDVAGATTGVGLVAGGEASSKNVTVSNCYLSSADGIITNVFTGDDFAINYEEDGTTIKSVSEGTVGIDDLPAVAGEDYQLYTTKLGLLDAIAEGKLPENLTKGAAKLGLVTPIAKANVTSLQTVTDGYFYLTEDIDMSDVTWQNYTSASFSAAIAFKGVLNGVGYTIDNFTTTSTGQVGGLFYYMSGATIKNIAFTNATVIGNIQGLIGRDFRNGSLLENAYIHVKSAGSGSGPIFGVLESSTNTKFKDVTIVIDNGGKSFINSTFADQITLDNCYFVGPAGKEVIYKGSLSGTINGTANTDYFVYSDKATFASDVINDKTSMTEFVKGAYLDNQVTFIGQDNIRDLETATTGVIMLTEDIDMTGITWNPTAGFAATLDGNGHTIKNFTASAGYVGLVGNTAAGATIKNLTLHALTNGNRAVLTGQIQGATTVSNCKFIVDNLTAGYQSVIANVVQGALTVENTYIAIAQAAANQTLPGIVAGGEASSSNVTVSNVYAVSLSGNITEMFKGDNCDNANLKETTVGKDGQLAVNGEDYVLYADTNALVTAVEEGTINADFKSWLTEIGYVKAVTNANFAEMQNGVTGYWYLTEDIDMTNIDFNGEEDGLGAYSPDSSSVVYGIFDGKGYTVSGLTFNDHAQIGLFVSMNGNATVKNFVLKAGIIDKNNNAVLVASIRNTGNVVENVVIDVEKFASYNGGIIARNLAGEVTIKDVMVIVRDSAINSNNGILFGNYAAAANATVDGLYIVDLATSETKITNLTNGYPVLLGTDGVAAVQGEDYFYATSISGINANGISTELRELIEVANPGFFG